MSKHLDDLPLFATDNEIGRALMGPKRCGEWSMVVERLTLRGFPEIDDLMGGRYVPAVVAFFDRRYGLTDSQKPVSKPDGEENWNGRKSARPQDHAAPKRGKEGLLGSARRSG